jgi:hypothetical protein
LIFRTARIRRSDQAILRLSKTDKEERNAKTKNEENWTCQVGIIHYVLIDTTERVEHREGFSPYVLEIYTKFLMKKGGHFDLTLEVTLYWIHLQVMVARPPYLLYQTLSTTRLVAECSRQSLPAVGTWIPEHDHLSLNAQPNSSLGIAHKTEAVLAVAEDNMRRGQRISCRDLAAAAAT